MALAGSELYEYIALLLQYVRVQGRIIALCSRGQLCIFLDITYKNSACDIFSCVFWRYMDLFLYTGVILTAASTNALKP